MLGRTFGLLFLFIFIGANTLCRADNLDLSSFSTEKINDYLYVMSKDYGDSSINFAFVVGDRHTALISSMMKQDNAQVRALMAHITQAPLGYLFAIDGDHYHYYGSRYFVEHGATFVAHRNLIPEVFDNRILVDKTTHFNLGGEQIDAIPTYAHTQDHMLVKLVKSNVIFAGDAISFDWITYAGANGVDYHIKAIKQMIALGDEYTRYYPGNWVKQQVGNQAQLQALLSRYIQFVKLVRKLSIKGKEPLEIADHPEIIALLRPLNDFERQRPYIINYVNDVLGLEEDITGSAAKTR